MQSAKTQNAALSKVKGVLATREPRSVRTLQTLVDPLNARHLFRDALQTPHQLQERGPAFQLVRSEEQSPLNRELWLLSSE